MELESVKKQSDTRLHRIEKKFLDRLNQIENRFAHLEGRSKIYGDDDYYYDSNPPENFDSQN